MLTSDSPNSTGKAIEWILLKKRQIIKTNIIKASYFFPELTAKMVTADIKINTWCQTICCLG